MANNILHIVQGNTFTLRIPLQVYILDEGTVDVQDFVPEATDSVNVRLIGERRQYTYTPGIEGNVVSIALGGYESADAYAVEVSVGKADGSRLRSFRTSQLVVTESSDDLTAAELAAGLESGAAYLTSAVFVAGKDGRGIVSITKTATQGLVDTYTITYTDGTASTFQVTNGADGAQGLPGRDGVDGSDGVGIASLVQTQTSTASGGVNVWTATMTDGTVYTFEVCNGKDGATPDMSGYYTKSESDLLLAAKAAKAMVVNITATTSGNVTTYAADKTPAEIAAAYNGGTSVVAKYGNFIYSLEAVVEILGNVDEARFSRADGVVNGVFSVTRTQGVDYTETLLQEALESGTDIKTINSESLLGSGNISLPTAADVAAKADPMPIINVSGTGDVTQALDVNKFYKFGEVDSLDLSLTAPASGILAQYYGKFTTSADWTALTLPASVTTSSKSDTIAAGNTYEFSIVDNVINISEI